MLISCQYIQNNKLAKQHKIVICYFSRTKVRRGYITSILNNGGEVHGENITLYNNWNCVDISIFLGVLCELYQLGSTWALQYECSRLTYLDL